VVGPGGYVDPRRLTVTMLGRHPSRGPRAVFG
jgi:hypothetical protein